MNPTLLTQGITALHGTISDRQIAQFSTYSTLLKEWNQKINLTAITDDDGISVKHFLDSLLPLYHIAFPEGSALADVGTGAGFPGIPMKIMRPDLRLTLVDSLQKRVGFLNEVSAALSLTQTQAVHGRAEEVGQNKIYREQFDIVTSRAVANLTVLSEYCLPLLRVGGMFVALKAEQVGDELQTAKPMIGSLGGKAEEVISAPLPNSDMTRKLIVIRKLRPTPPQFPRRPNQIKKAR